MSGATAVLPPGLSIDEPPAPPVTEFNEPAVTAAHEHRFVLARCDDCGTYIYPHGPVCTNCFSSAMTWTELSGRGVVRSWVAFHKSYHPYFDDKLPVTVAFVELEEGPRLIANVVDTAPDKIRSELPVEVTYEDYADFTLIQFRPAAS